MPHERRRRTKAEMSALRAEREAIPPDRLRRLVGDLIAGLLDPGEVERLRRVERAEQESLLALSAGQGGGRE
jgi:hypothetical protein